MNHSTQKLMSWAWALIFLAAVTVLPFSTGVRAQAPPGMRDPLNWPPMNLLANPIPNSNRWMLDSMKQQDNRKLFDKLNLQRQKVMTADTVKLVTLAIQLKAETDVTSRETPSVLTLHQAEEIEQLAHNVQDQMRANADVKR